MTALLPVLIAYLLGSIPAAYYAGKWAKGIDLRKEGSGNLGFTNTLRILGKKWGIPVLLFDIGKGIAAVMLAKSMVPGNEVIAVFCGLVAILGHNWTVFLGFKGGGKGVATSAGVFAALSPVPFIITLLVFLVVLVTTRFMSLASLVSAAVLAVSATVFWLNEYESAPSVEVLVFMYIAVLMIFVRHVSNIKRLLDGTENKFGAGKGTEG